MKSEIIGQLLDVWMEDREHGLSRSAAELCSGHPELEPELARSIQALTQFEKLSDNAEADTFDSQRVYGSSTVLEDVKKPNPVAASPMPGTIGGFTPVEKLGEGGMGAVYLSEDRQLGRKVAVKVMRQELAQDPTAKQRFLREARAMATVQHDNIMPIFAVGEDQGAPYLVMPALTGETLEDRLNREKRLAIPELFRIAREVAEGLAAAHAHGLVHRDIKPSNIWLEGGRGRVRILDFGLARPDVDDQRVTQSGAAIGTPAYMAPEQAAGESPTLRGDLFSLGAVLYRMTTGIQPFAGPNLMATLNNLAVKQPDPPHILDSNVPAEFSRIIMELLAKSPEHRPQSAEQVLQSIHKLEEDLLLKSKNKSPTRADSTTGITEAKSSKCSSGRTSGLRTLLTACLLGAVLLLAAVVYRIQTDHGTLIVSIDDDQVEARLTKNGLVILDSKTARKWTLETAKVKTLPSGDYKLEPIEGFVMKVIDDTGTEFNTQEFKIKRGDQITVRVTLQNGEEKNTKSASYGQSMNQHNRHLIDGEQSTALPSETVVVIGTSYGKTWGSPFYMTSGNMTFSPDGKWITECDFSNVYLYDANTLELKKRYPFAGHFLTSRWAAFSSDSQQLHVCQNMSTQTTMRNTITDLTSESLPTSADFDPQTSTVIALSPDDRWIAAEFDYGALSLGKRDPTTGTISWIQIAESDDLPPSPSLGRIVGLAFSPDGRWLICGHSSSSTGGYRIYRLQDNGFVPVADIPVNINQHSVRVAFSFTKDRKVAWLLGADSCNEVDLSLPIEHPISDSGFTVTKLDVLSGVLDISISADGLTWAASKNFFPQTKRPAILLGSWRDGVPTIERTLSLSATAVGHVALSPNGRTLAVSKEWRIVDTYDLTQDPPARQLGSEFTFTGTSSASPCAVTVGLSGSMQIQKVTPEGVRVLDSRTLDRGMHYVCVSEDGQRFVTFSPPYEDATGHPGIQVWDMAESKCRKRFEFTVPVEYSFAWMRLFQNGSRLLNGNQLWDISSSDPKLLTTFSKLPPKPAALAVSQDNRLVALVDDTSMLSVFEWSKSSEIPVATALLPAPPTSLAFSPDGSRLMTSHSPGQGVIWKLDGDHLTEQARMPSPFYHTTSVEFSEDGKRAFVGGQDGVFEWNLEENKLGRQWYIPGFTWLTRSSFDNEHYLVFHNSNCTTWILKL